MTTQEVSNIVKLFNAVYEYGKSIRQNNKKPDGLAKWNAIKILLERNKQEFKWTKSSKLLGEQINKFGFIEDKDKNDSNKETWEKHHFCLQLRNIPKKEASLMRFMQIAYNLGQLKYFLETKPEIYKGKISLLQFYRYDDMNTFMAKKDYEQFEITDEFLEEMIEAMNKEISQKCNL